MTIQTLRHKLPLLAVGQAQKEYTHNEALVMIDNLMNLTVLGVVNDPDIAVQAVAQDYSQNIRNWLIGRNARGDWRDKTNQIAIETDNGWRYIEPLQSMILYNIELNNRMIYKGIDWHIASVISVPEGGDNTDTQARESIDEIIELLRLFGWSR